LSLDLKIFIGGGIMTKEDKFSKTIGDEQLDEVAGGTSKEIEKDAKFLKELGYDIEKNTSATQIYNTWLELGIVCNPHSSNKNTYAQAVEYNNGDDLRSGVTYSRQDAMIIAMRNSQKVVDLDNYL